MNFKQEEGEKRFASVYELVAQFKSFFFAATLIHLRMQIFTWHSSFLVTRLFSLSSAWICVINWHQCVNDEARGKKKQQSLTTDDCAKKIVATRRHNGKSKDTKLTENYASLSIKTFWNFQVQFRSLNLNLVVIYFQMWVAVNHWFTATCSLVWSTDQIENPSIAPLTFVEAEKEKTVISFLKLVYRLQRQLRG